MNEVRTIAKRSYEMAQEKLYRDNSMIYVLLQDLILRENEDALLVYVLVKEKDLVQDVPVEWTGVRSKAMSDGACTDLLFPQA